MRSSRVLLLTLLSANALACEPRTPTEVPVASAPPPIEAPLTPPTASQNPETMTTPNESPPNVDPPTRDALGKLADSSNAFGFDLYRRLRKKPGNMIISPASITTALAMTWGGAKAETADQMKKVLHLEGTPEEVMTISGKLAQSLQNPSRPVVFRIANQLFGEKTYKFESAYLEKTKSAYGAPLELVDFKGAPEPARLLVNGWVEKKTEQRIKDLVPPRGIDAETRLVLVNAIYFLGDWAEPFAKEQTRAQPWNLSKTATKDVPTMNRTDTFNTVQKDGVTALELPYKGGEMSMTLLVPDAVDGLGALESSLEPKKLASLLSGMKSERVWLSLPKFEVKPTESLALGEDLKAMGMPLAFDRDKADFTGIANPSSPVDRLVIGQVFHKGFVRVDEKGTEAAAATSVNMARAGAAPMKPRELKVDRPFMFLIRDNASGLVLFMGRVADPSAI